MTDAERFDLIARTRDAADSAKDPKWSAYLSAVADWLRDGARHGNRPSFTAFFAGSTKPPVFHADGREDAR